MRTPRAIARNLARLAVVGGVTAVVVGGGPVMSQPSGPATMPVVRQTVTVPVDTDPPAPAPRGLATTGTGSRAGLATVNAVTEPCPQSSRNESRLGLMNNTAMYAHCDYP
jgi:hypothetical protein